MADLCADADQHGGVGARAVLALLSLSRAVLSALPRRDAPRPGALHPAARRAEPPPLPRTKWTRRVPPPQGAAGLSLEVRAGALAGVISAAGEGKASLRAAVAGLMPRLSGSVLVPRGHRVFLAAPDAPLLRGSPPPPPSLPY